MFNDRVFDNLLMEEFNAMAINQAASKPKGP